MTLVRVPGREAIRRHQLAALGRLIGKVARGNAFYAPRLERAGLDAGVGDLDAFTARMPVTRKTDLIEDQRRHPPYGSNLTYPLDRYSRFHQTSATGGAPLRWLDTAESWQSMVDNWKQVLSAAGVERAERLYFAFSFGPFLGFWTAFDAATQTGCLSIPGGGLSSLARLEAMRDNRATVLLCTPSYALRLGEVAAEEGIDLGAIGVRTILVAGEPGGSVPAVRARIEERWPGAAVFDHHGMTEVGPVSYQCPEKPGTLMVLERSYFAEVLDLQADAPVEQGQLGELVLTTLGRAASPLMRYRTGDLVREDTEVATRFGRHEMALAGGILGRADDMLFVRGVNLYPGAVEDVIRSFPEVVEYEVAIRQHRSMPEMQIRVETAGWGDGGPALAERIQARMRALWNLRVSVSACPAGTLPRFEMKARRWIRG